MFCVYQKRVVANQNCTMVDLVVAVAIPYHHEKKTVATPYRHKKA
jgi:hypothetical protein